MEVTVPLKTEAEGPCAPGKVAVESPTVDPVMLQYPSEYVPYG